MMDLIEIFTRTFNEFYKEKRLAKKQIKFLENNYRFWKKTTQTFCDFYEVLYHHDEVRPRVKDRGAEATTHIINFLTFGTKKENGEYDGKGYIYEINRFHKEKLEALIDTAKRSYEVKNYKYITRLCEEYCEVCKSFDEYYGTASQYEAIRYPRAEK